MKSDKNILVAFLLNMLFSLFELCGGLFTGSVAILSDSLHDLGDAVSIGISWGLEKKSKKQPDDVYTYGYARYSVVGSVITTAVLFAGSVLVIYESVMRILHPVPIHYNGMIVMGLIGVAVNTLAAFFTREGDSLNQKAVNLHMLEDVLGWIVVLCGAVIMRFTDFALIDSFMSIGVSLFILVHALKNLKESVDIFLEKMPKELNKEEISAHLAKIEGVESIHHLHIWTLDGQSHYATLHAVTDNPAAAKKAIREELTEHGICHATVETEAPNEDCGAAHCKAEHREQGHRHHHH